MSRKATIISEKVEKRRITIAKRLADRLRLFDAATDRQRQREEAGTEAAQNKDRGWRREDLYERAHPL